MRTTQNPRFAVASLMAEERPGPVVGRTYLPGLTRGPCPRVVILHAEADKGWPVVMRQGLWRIRRPASFGD